MIRQFLHYYRPHRRLLALDFGCAALSGVLELLFPMAVRGVIDHLLPQQDLYVITVAMAGLFVVYLLNSGLMAIVTYYGHVLGIAIETELRRRAFDHLQKLSLSFYDNQKTGHLVGRVTKDLEEIGEVAHHGPEDLLIAILTFAGTITPPLVAQDLYTESVKLFDEGRYAEAAIGFDAVLKQRPNHVYARSYLGKSRAAIAQGASVKQTIEARLAKVVVPEINFQDASLGDVLDYVSARTGELTNGQLTPNVIYKGSGEQRQNTRITLSLRNVPMTEVIRYVGQLSNTRFSYDEHAVVAERVMLAAGPSARNPTANYRIEFMPLGGQVAETEKQLR